MKEPSSAVTEVEAGSPGAAELSTEDAGSLGTTEVRTDERLPESSSVAVADSLGAPVGSTSGSERETELEMAELEATSEMLSDSEPDSSTVCAPTRAGRRRR